METIWQTSYNNENNIESWIHLLYAFGLFRQSSPMQKVSLGPTCQILPSRLELQNTPTASLQRGKTPPTSVLIMTLNNLKVRFQ